MVDKLLDTATVEDSPEELHTLEVDYSWVVEDSYEEELHTSGEDYSWVDSIAVADNILVAVLA